MCAHRLGTSDDWMDCSSFLVPSYRSAYKLSRKLYLFVPWCALRISCLMELELDARVRAAGGRLEISKGHHVSYEEVLLSSRPAS